MGSYDPLVSPTRPLRILRERIKRQIVRVCRLIAKCVILFAGVYLAIIVIGLIPVNSDFQPTENGIEISVVSNAVHADLVLPVSNDVIDWRDVFPSHCFPSNTLDADRIAIGWGDKGFVLYTKTLG